jgi:protein phosphatase
MFRPIDTASKTDVGRQRRDNEDSLFVREPLFVVADGMGGAQAGEIASNLAVESFQQAMPDDGTPEERLVATVQEANRRIYELAQAKSDRQGMGTTLTAAYLDSSRLAIAHVGDSRAYLFRDGALQRLTEDHSLVAELVRRGKLTEAQAEEHPQRSIITRALGPEPSVEVDTWSYPVQDGDVLLLCSDGLTSMVPEARIAATLAAHGDLDAAASALIAEANEAGGRDNITVILTRMEEVGDDPVPGAGEAATATAVLSRTERDKETKPSLPRLDDAKPPLKPSEAKPPLRSADPRQQLAAPVAAPGDKNAPGRHPAGARRGPVRARGAPGTAVRKRYARPLAALTAVVIVLAVLSAGGYLATRQLFFIGTNSQGIVTIYRGLPYDLPFGIHLYETFYTSGVPAVLIPADRRPQVLGHHLRSQSDAQGLVRELELGRLSG